MVTKKLEKSNDILFDNESEIGSLRNEFEKDCKKYSDEIEVLMVEIVI